MRLAILFSAVALTQCGGAEQAPAPAEEQETATTASLDPVVVAPDNYEVVLENDYVRVLRTRYAAGESTPTHEHPDRMSVELTAGGAEMTSPDGEVTELSWDAGEASWKDATRHSVTAKSDLESLAIEMKGAGGDAIPIAERDAVAVDPEANVVEFENERVRVVRTTYPAGATSPVHAHLPGVEVALSASQTRTLREESETEPVGVEAGTVSWSEGEPPHARENVGDEDFVILRVEMKRRP